MSTEKKSKPTGDDRFNMNSNRFNKDIDMEPTSTSTAVEGQDGDIMPTKKKSKMRKDAEKYAAALKKRGVIYLSKVPPFMNPNKMRNLFEPYGEVTRLYLAEEDSTVRKKRQKNGGNGSKQFSEGWIEFADKKIARNVAESLNSTNIASKKGDYYHDDMWNLKYLSGFKWDYLTEKFAYERRTREHKLNAAISQAKKSNAEFVQLIEKQAVSKIIDGRKGKKRSRNEEDGSGGGEETVNVSKRSFKQAKVLGVNHDEI